MNKILLFGIVFLLLVMSVTAYFEYSPAVVITYLDTPTMCIPYLCPVGAYCHLFNTDEIIYLNFSSIPDGTLMTYEVNT